MIEGPNARDQTALYAFYSFFVEAQGNASYIQLTPDNSNSLGKWKKRSSYREFEANNRKKGNKEMEGEGMQVSCTHHLKGSKK